jgi:probable aminopeptidase NPEPL1
MAAKLDFPRTTAAALRGAETVLLIAPAAPLRAGWIDRAFPSAPWRRLLARAAKETSPGRRGKSVTTLTPSGSPSRLVLSVLPDAVSRHNAPSRADFAASAAAGADLGGGRSAVVACVEDAAHALPLAAAVARSLPLYHRAKRPNGAKPGVVSFLAVDPKGRPVPLSPADRQVVERLRWAASLVDAPTEEMDTAAFEREVRRAARGIRGLRVESIVGDALLRKGLGGIHAVGRAAEVAPRLLLLTWSPRRARRKVGLVGKGVVYDTGGLALKPRDGMFGMKADMGGAAAVCGATLALAAAGHPDAIVAAAPLAENAIGPRAYRNGDIVTLHGGKTIEINNTDAEGRLLLGDAVSFLARERGVDAVIDAATLTGAQSVATGIRHAAVVSNREGLEALAVRAGRESGDLTHPLPFAPEFFQDEFHSKVADMKNSVANRANAQSSCAAQFVYAQVDDLDVPWLHVDLAGPAFRDERATGYGVPLLAAVCRGLDAAALA